jgi:hypothetical protein
MHSEVLFGEREREKVRKEYGKMMMWRKREGEGKGRHL